MARARTWFRRYGVWSLLLAWIPGIGDALVVVAGVLRVGVVPFLILVAIGKAFRYVVLALALNGLVVPWLVRQPGAGRLTAANAQTESVRSSGVRDRVQPRLSGETGYRAADRQVHTCHDRGLQREQPGEQGD